MGIPGILQESLIKANNERHKWHNIVQGLEKDSRPESRRSEGSVAKRQRDKYSRKPSNEVL